MAELIIRGHPTSYEIELFGGHADGRTHVVRELSSHFNTMSVGIDADWLAAEPVEPILDIVTYSLEYNQATGKPRQTPEGRYIYRHGPRPTLPKNLPHAIADAFPRAHHWESKGDGRWRALEPLTRGVDVWLYVLTLTEYGRTAYVADRVSFEALDLARFDLDGRVFDELEYRCRDMLLPECVVPGCTERGRMLFHAAARGRLAGREWQSGDEIRLCHPHAHDVYRAVGCVDVDQLAGWLRPDAIAFQGLFSTPFGPVE